MGERLLWQAKRFVSLSFFVFGYRIAVDRVKLLKKAVFFDERKDEKAKKSLKKMLTAFQNRDNYETTDNTNMIFREVIK